MRVAGDTLEELTAFTAAVKQAIEGQGISGGTGPRSTIIKLFAARRG